jgi:hypothetical protein
VPELDRIEVSVADLAAALEGFLLEGRYTGVTAYRTTQEPVPVVVLHPAEVADVLYRTLSANAAHRDPEPVGHAAEAGRLFGLVDDAAGRAGRAIPADVGVQLGIGHALLAIEDALARLPDAIHDAIHQAIP